MQIPKIEIYREQISSERLYIKDPKIYWSHVGYRY